MSFPHHCHVFLTSLSRMCHVIALVHIIGPTFWAHSDIFIILQSWVAFFVNISDIIYVTTFLRFRRFFKTLFFLILHNFHVLESTHLGILRFLYFMAIGAQSNLGFSFSYF